MSSIWDFLKWLLTEGWAILSRLDSIDKKQGDIMAKFDEVKAQAEQNTAAIQKSLGEVRTKIDELTAQQGNIDAKIEEAKAAVRAEDTAAFEGKLDEIKAEQDKQSATLKTLDDIVPDAAPR
jgi:hypothetical protein